MGKLKLREINLRGFKSFSYEKGATVALNDINVMLGANGSGKSNFISFFKMLTALVEGKFQNYVAASGTANLFLYYGIKKTKKMDISFLFCAEDVKYQFELELAYAIPDTLFVEREQIKEVGTYVRYSQENVRELTPVGVANMVSDSGGVDLIEPVYNYLSNCKVFQFHDTTPDSLLRLPSHIDSAEYLQSNGANLAACLYRMKSEFPDYYNRIVEYIREIMPQFGDFCLQPNRAGYVMLTWTDNTGNDYLQLPQQLSDGSLRFMALAALLLQSPDRMPAVIILDEPELGLHPAAINQLAEMVEQASQYAQVILATQSPELANEFEPSQIMVVERDEENASTTINRLDEDKLKGWIERYTISELWNKNVIGGRP